MKRSLSIDKALDMTLDHIQQLRFIVHRTHKMELLQRELEEKENKKNRASGAKSSKHNKKQPSREPIINSNKIGRAS